MFGNEGKGTVNFDTIAKNIFGSDAENFKRMAQNMNQQQINEIMMKFQSLPQEKKQQFLKEVQEEINRTSKSSNATNVGVEMVRGRW